MTARLEIITVDDSRTFVDFYDDKDSLRKVLNQILEAGNIPEVVFDTVDGQVTQPASAPLRTVTVILDA